MSGSPWPWFALLALLFFWMLGAYNRLVALRAAILAAWNQADAALKIRAQVIAALLSAVQHRLDGEEASLGAASAAHGAHRTAWEAVRLRPAEAGPIAELVATEGALAGRLARVVALVEQRHELVADPGVAASLQGLRELEPQLAFARQAFNEAGARYDAALHQFPTRLLQPVFGFGPSGRL